MNDVLNKSTVLVLNRHWQAIHVKTPAEAFCMVATCAATALDVQGDDYIAPVRWDDWLKLPVREHDNAVNTPRGPVRVPTVIVAGNYAKVPLRRPRFGARRGDAALRNGRAGAEEVPVAPDAVDAADGGPEFVLAQPGRGICGLLSRVGMRPVARDDRSGGVWRVF